MKRSFVLGERVVSASSEERIEMRSDFDSLEQMMPSAKEVVDVLKDVQGGVELVSSLLSQEVEVLENLFSVLLKLAEFLGKVSVNVSILPVELGNVIKAQLTPEGKLMIIREKGDITSIDLSEATNRDLLVDVIKDLIPKLKNHSEYESPHEEVISEVDEPPVELEEEAIVFEEPEPSEEHLVFESQPTEEELEEPEPSEEQVVFEPQPTEEKSEEPIEEASIRELDDSTRADEILPIEKEPGMGEKESEPSNFLEVVAEPVIKKPVVTPLPSKERKERHILDEPIVVHAIKQRIAVKRKSDVKIERLREVIKRNKRKTQNYMIKTRLKMNEEIRVLRLAKRKPDQNSLEKKKDKSNLMTRLVSRIRKFLGTDIIDNDV